MSRRSTRKDNSKDALVDEVEVEAWSIYLKQIKDKKIRLQVLVHAGLKEEEMYDEAKYVQPCSVLATRLARKKVSLLDDEECYEQFADTFEPVDPEEEEQKCECVCVCVCV
jgi:hypothetical protein